MEIMCYNLDMLNDTTERPSPPRTEPAIAELRPALKHLMAATDQCVCPVLRTVLNGHLTRALAWLEKGRVD
jgi:hypothetical protein